MFNMHKLLKQSLFSINRDRFQDIEEKAIGFADRNIGSGVILQDDIFNILANYDSGIDLLLFPIKDDEICGFVCNRKGRIFVYVNTNLPLEKQIFTAAHELYHLRFNREEIEEGYLIKPCTLSDTANELSANLFAALLLVPTEQLKKQIEIFHIDRSNLSILDMVRLMDVFAVPYKTMVLRLYESNLIDEKKANQLLQIPDREDDRGILYEMNKHEIGLRWQERTRRVKYNNLKALIMDNDEEELIARERAAADRDYILQDIDHVLGRLAEKGE